MIAGVGISLDSDIRLAGYCPATFKNALRAFNRTGSPAALIDLKSLFPLRSDGAIVFEECIDRRLIDAETLTLTAAGEAIARAKAKSRTSLTKAQLALDQFLGCIEAMNQDPDAVEQVDQVWLFGSLLRGEESVGDIDLALTKTRRPQFASDHRARERHLDALLARIDGAPRSWARPWAKEEWLTDRAIYGRRRNPLFASVQDSTRDLESLGVPCRLIYDRVRGGVVDDPVLRRHPSSQGRDPKMEAPAELPDLRPLPLRPMDARWVAGFQQTGVVSPYHIFRGWTEEAHKLFPVYPSGLRVVGEGFDLGSYSWTPSVLRRRGLDGRSAIALLNVANGSGTSLVLERAIHTETGLWTLQADFHGAELLRARQRAHAETLPDLVAVAALIVAADAERMVRRAMEASSRQTITVCIGGSELGDDLEASFIEPICECLRSRTVRIEPPGCPGGEVAVMKASKPG